MGKLKDKTALITGGSSGIGLASAQLFRNEGARVIIVGRDQKKLNEACVKIGSDTLGICGDIAKVEDIEQIMAVVEKEFGSIDIVFANAGMSHCPSLEETTEPDFDHIVGVNLKGVFFTVVKALKLLNEKSSVILTSSAAHEMGRLGDPLYSATKAAVRSLVRSFAVQDTISKKSIRVNAITPGCIATPLTEVAVAKAEVTAYLESLIPMGRWGQAEEVAKAVLFLASEDSSYMTGAEISVDGGLAQV